MTSTKHEWVQLLYSITSFSASESVTEVWPIDEAGNALDTGERTSTYDYPDFESMRYSLSYTTQAGNNLALYHDVTFGFESFSSNILETRVYRPGLDTTSIHKTVYRFDGAIGATYFGVEPPSVATEVTVDLGTYTVDTTGTAAGFPEWTTEHANTVTDLGTGTYLSFEWVDVGSIGKTLFTEDGESRNLNSLDPTDFDFTFANDAMGGDDFVTLPDTLVKWQQWGFDSVPTFSGGKGNDSIAGGKLDDIIGGGGGNDTIIGSLGADQLSGGKGNDVFDYREASVLASGVPAVHQSIDGGKQDWVYGTKYQADLDDLIFLPGRPDDYTITTDVGANGPSSTTHFTSIKSGTSIDTTNVEKVFFDSAITGTNLAPENVYNVAANLMISAYDRAWPQPTGFHRLSAIELGMSPRQNGAKSYTFDDGRFKSATSAYGSAEALVQTRMINGSITLSISFAGTNDLQDIVDDVLPFAVHYANFKPLIDSLHSYVSDDRNGIKKIMVDGHSLGGAMAEMFIRDEEWGVPVSGYVWANPGLSTPPVGANMINFVNGGDDIPHIAGLKYSGGEVVMDRFGILNAGFEHHAKFLYQANTAFLVEQAGLGSAFSQTALASSLRNGVPFLKSMRLEVGTDGKDELHPFGKDVFSLAGEGNDRFVIDQANVATVSRIIDGGAGNDTFDATGMGTGIEITLQGSKLSIVKSSNKIDDRIANIENLVGTNFADKLTGDAGNNLIKGGRGADILSGGGGTDVFEFSASCGKDTIKRFTHDIVDLSEIPSIRNFADLKANHLHYYHGDAVITVTASDSITLDGISDVAIRDFLFV